MRVLALMDAVERFDRFLELSEINPDALLADGFEEAYIGYVHLPTGVGAVAVYSRKGCIEILMTRDGMTDEDAEEFFDFNVCGSYVGPFTPLFLEDEKLPG
jgi:hypothetical protein